MVGNDGTTGRLTCSILQAYTHTDKMWTCTYTPVCKIWASGIYQLTSTSLLNKGSLATRSHKQIEPLCASQRPEYLSESCFFPVLSDYGNNSIFQALLVCPSKFSTVFKLYMEGTHWQKQLQPQLPVSPQTEAMHGLEVACSLESRLHSGCAGTELCHSPVPSTALGEVAPWLWQLWLPREASPGARVENPHKHLEEP